MKPLVNPYHSTLTVYFWPHPLDYSPQHRLIASSSNWAEQSRIQTSSLAPLIRPPQRPPASCSPRCEWHRRNSYHGFIAQVYTRDPEQAHGLHMDIERGRKEKRTTLRLLRAEDLNRCDSTTKSSQYTFTPGSQSPIPAAPFYVSGKKLA